MTSASEAILAKGDELGIGGISDVTITLAVDVGERCKARGCEWLACTEAVAE